MRNFFVRAVLLTGLFILLIAVFMVYLSQGRPLRPGNLIFPVQYLAERQQARQFSSPIELANFELLVLERRIDDLMVRSGTHYEQAAVQYLEIALDQATDAIAHTTTESPETQTNLRIRLFNLVQQVQDALLALQFIPQENPDTFQTFQAKIESLTALLENTNIPNLDELESNLYKIILPITFSSSDQFTNPDGAPNPVDIGLINSQGVPFPPGSEGATHAFYPLTGQHATLECTGCHPNNQYAGTPTQCVACHLDKLPLNHFTGTCETCHTPTFWQDATFNHQLYGATNCIYCHTVDKPPNHYAGQCSNCHTSTISWVPVYFDHLGYTDCQSCHAADVPPNHYAGQCSNCHTSTVAWATVTFNHSGFTDCQSCHAADAPPNHYAGQCSNCHTSTVAWATVTFNHTGFTDCQSCHAADAPPNHYPGQCSNCHTSTIAWLTVTFNHSGFTDCQACHAADAPPNHYAGQCSNCHTSTTAWATVTFNHTGYMDCQSCHSNDSPPNHYAGQCSNCHTSTITWLTITFDHTGYTDCQSCHSPSTRDHYPGQCSDCHHNFSTWIFDHSDITNNCITCHADDRPDPPHPQIGQCSNCHNPNHWTQLIIGLTRLFSSNNQEMNLVMPHHLHLAHPSPGTLEQLAFCQACHQ